MRKFDLRWLWSSGCGWSFPPGQNFLSTKPLPYLVSQYSNTASVSCLSCPLEKVSPEQPSKVPDGCFSHRFADRVYCFFGLSSCSVHIEPSGSLRVFLSEHLRERTIKKHRRFFTLEKITTLFPSILLSVNLYYRVQSTIHYLSKGIRYFSHTKKKPKPTVHARD